MASLSKFEKQIQWAANVRKTERVEKQAQIFYESYRLAIQNDDSHQTRISDLKHENEKLQQFKMCME